MEGGNVRVRRRPGDKVATAALSFQWTSAQVVIWEDFLTNEIANGTSRFVMQLQVNGAACARRLVQITGAVAYRGRQGPRYLYEFSVLVFPAEMTPPFEGALDFSAPDNSQLIPIIF